MFIDPTRELVIARASAWPADWIEKYDDHTHSFYDGLMAFIDARSILVVEYRMIKIDHSTTLAQQI